MNNQSPECSDISLESHKHQDGATFNGTQALPLASEHEELQPQAIPDFPSSSHQDISSWNLQPPASLQEDVEVPQEESENSNDAEFENLRTMALQRQRLLHRLEQCQCFFVMISLVFLTLTIMSVVEYCLIWKRTGKDDIYVLICCFQNALHTYFFGIEMYKVANKRIRALRLHYLEPLHDYLEFYQGFTLMNVLFFLVSKRLQLFKFNQTVFSIMFVFGVARLYTSAVQPWYMICELALGFILFGALLGLMLGVCLFMPIMFCCMFFFNQRPMPGEDFLDIPEAPEVLESLHIILPQAVQYSTLTSTNAQPCYICLQEYTSQELVVQVPCHAKHVFHQECIEPWVESNPCCPVCRQDLH